MEEPLSPLKKMVLYTTLALLYADVFSGVLRYAYNALGINILSYVPMLLTIAAVTGAGFIHGAKTAFDKRVLAIAAFFMCYSVYGFMVGRSPLGILFSLYAWSPLFLGILLLRLNLLRRLTPHIYTLLLASVIGVYLTSVISVPWASSQTFTVAGVEVDTVRQWQAYGVDRLPGFSRSSAVVGADIPLFLLWALCLSRYWLVKLSLWAASVYAIVLTTSKTPLIISIVGPILLFLYMRLSHSRVRAAKRPKQGLLIYSYGILVALLVCVILPPLLPDTTKISNLDLSAGGLSQALPFLRMGSFTDRAENTWPNAFELVHVGPEKLQSFLGRGIGGIGIGQQFTESDISNSADSLSVFLYVTFGFCSCLFYAVLIVGHRNAISGRRMDPSIYFATLIGVLGLGTLISVVEAPIPTLACGVLLSACLAPRIKRNRFETQYLQSARHQPAVVPRNYPAATVTSGSPSPLINEN